MSNLHGLSGEPLESIFASCLIVSAWWYLSCCHIQSNLLERPPPNKDHLSTKTMFLNPQMANFNRNWPLNKDHLSTKTAIFVSRGCSLFTGLTVQSKGKTVENLNYSFSKQTQVIENKFINNQSWHWSDSLYKRLGI